MATKKKLTLGDGQMPRGWGMPNPVFNFENGTYEIGGMVWHGKKPTSKKDIAALRAHFGPKVKIDMPTTRGKASPKYSRFDERMKRRKAYKDATTIVLGR